jgi:hypothetical protein
MVLKFETGGQTSAVGLASVATLSHVMDLDPIGPFDAVGLREALDRPTLPL